MSASDTAVPGARLELRRNLTVAWGECDPLGIIFYPTYFLYFDVSSHRLFEMAGQTIASMREDYGLAGPVIVDVRAQFRKPVSHGDVLEAVSFIDEWHSKLFRVAHEIYKDGALVCEGYELRAWAVTSADSETGFRAQPIPDEFRKLFEG